MSRIARSCAVGLIAAVPFAATADARPVSKAVKRVYRDCSDGRINRTHKLRIVRKAKRTLPRDLRQYTGCQRALRREIRRRT